MRNWSRNWLRHGEEIASKMFFLESWFFVFVLKAKKNYFILWQSIFLLVCIFWRQQQITYKVYLERRRIEKMRKKNCAIKISVLSQIVINNLKSSLYWFADEFLILKTNVYAWVEVENTKRHNKSFPATNMKKPFQRKQKEKCCE